MVCQPERGVAVHMAVGTGRAQKLCQVDQGVMIYTLQKPITSLHSAPTVTNAASQRELWWEHTATQVSCCRCALLVRQHMMAVMSTSVGGVSM